MRNIIVISIILSSKENSLKIFSLDIEELIEYFETSMLLELYFPMFLPLCTINSSWIRVHELILPLIEIISLI